MKIIDRYVSSSLLLTGSFAVAVLSVVLVLGNIFKKLLDLLVSHDAPIELVLSFIAYILPFSLTFTIPWGFLTAVLLVFGKMSAENELIALRATGVSISRICASVFVLAIGFAGICLWINVEVAPRAQSKMKDALYNIATNNPLAMFTSDKVITDFPEHRIYVERHDGDKLYNLLVYVLDERDNVLRVIHAQNGWLETDHAKKQLLLHVYDASFEQHDETQPTDLTMVRQGTMKESTLPISLASLLEKNKNKHGIGTLTVSELLDRMDKADQDATPREKALAHTAAMTEVSKRFSFALATLAFGLIGVPLAITAQRKETSIGFLLSVAVAFAYFMFFIVIADAFRNRPEAHPELLVWLPNVVFLAIGAVLFYRLSRR